jgi:hypothetical protein
VLYLEGNTNVVLSAPHGGKVGVPGATDRSKDEVRIEGGELRPAWHAQEGCAWSRP